MKKIILSGLFSLFVLILFENCRSVKHNVSIKSPYDFDQSLVQYGEMIYTQESCSSCHTLQLNKESQSIISLDGLGAKYPNFWLFKMVLTPDIFLPQSGMPSYPNLNISLLDRQKMNTIVEAKAENQQLDKDLMWEELKVQADSLYEELAKDEPQVGKRTEVLALIAYLQQIPSSKYRMKIDSIEQLKELEKEKVWEQVKSNNYSKVLEIADNKESIDRGRHHFKSTCMVCHGAEGGGGIGPNLTDEYWLHGGSSINIARTIIYGIPEKGMISWRQFYTPEEIGELLGYIVSLRGTKPDQAKAPQGKKE